MGGRWYQASAEWLTLDDGTITEWRPRAGQGLALPAQPNRGNARLDLAGLRLVPASNCGFCVADAAADAADFSFAVLCHPGVEELRTLLTLNLQGAKNYLFLSHQAGQVSFKSQSDSGEVSLPMPSGAPVLLVAGFSRGRFFLRAGAEAAQSATPPDTTITGPADLFIGCRSHREGLPKTLGDGHIAQVFFWPRNILDPKDPAGAPQLAALEDYLFWEA
ncbi:hypothetical protein AKL17_1295 [Frigidibacter mobilis]|uniref:Uncharacterized protein n=1 Tax=Frigidibacter mobilis TaxID=1335048 RepID=A0A159Z0X6_9RHOB|nr:hypothetical protein AKL17_1295 [Frigidibacter mobilis]